MVQITKDELASMIAALESQPHLSMKEEKYLAIMKELSEFKSLEAIHMPYTGGGNFYGYGFHRVGDEETELDIEDIFYAKVKGVMEY